MQSRLLKSVLLGAMLILLGTYLYLNRVKLYWLDAQYHEIRNGPSARELRFLARGRELAACDAPLTDNFDSFGHRQLGFCRVSDKQLLGLKNEIQHLAVIVNGHDVPKRLQNRDNDLVLDLPNERIYLVSRTDFNTVAGLIGKERSQRRDIIACRDAELCRTIRVIGGSGWGALEGPYPKTDVIDTRAGQPLGRWGYGPKTELTIQSTKRQKVMVAIYMDQFSPKQRASFEGNVLVTRRLQSEGIAFSYLRRRLYPTMYLLELSLERGNNKIAIHYSRWNQPSRIERRPIAAYLTGIKFRERI
ncbi:MAG: hypothetical protein ACE5FH_11490 [Candidatus Zixiibacteriota bacterium]